MIAQHAQNTITGAINSLTQIESIEHNVIAPQIIVHLMFFFIMMVLEVQQKLRRTTGGFTHNLYPIGIDLLLFTIAEFSHIDLLCGLA